MANAVRNQTSSTSAPKKTSPPRSAARPAPTRRTPPRPPSPRTSERTTVSREAVGKPQAPNAVPNFAAAFKPAEKSAPATPASATPASPPAPPSPPASASPPTSAVAPSTVPTDRPLESTSPGRAEPATRTSDRDNPAAIEPNGDLDYYRRRNEDFLRRNPGLEPPDYYMNYGDKYANRFTEELRPQLSERGQQWLDDARRNLQERLEVRRAEDPRAFAELERDNEAFRRFAYDTHPGAYLDAGLSSLPPRDLVRIPLTPDRRDLLSPDGIRQIGSTGLGVASDWARNIGNRIADTSVGRTIGQRLRSVADTEVGQRILSGTRAGLGAARQFGERVANTEAGQAIGRGLHHVGEMSLRGLSNDANRVVDGVEYVADTRVGRAMGDGARWVAESAPGQWAGGHLNNAWDWLNRQWE